LFFIVKVYIYNRLPARTADYTWYTNADIFLVVFAFKVYKLVFLYNFIASIFYGKKAVQNPWKSNTLEWTTPVEHIHGNWPGEIPHVERWAYDYSKPGHDEDFIPQNVPLAEGEEELQH
jgi:cytochrome c oxidase subunit 1